MRAIYESKNPYAQVGYWDVNGVTVVRGLYSEKAVVGTLVQMPDSFSERTHFYNFCEGDKHNQLTIEDPVEIQNMRVWVKYHPDFKEVSCEDVPEDISSYVKSLKPVEPEEEQAEHKCRDNHNEDWDREMEKRMMM